ncbi:MAG: hypothetical protein HY042_07910 [Spirochaetia bacterium]|nr:hypothetical protein [Spirochaetia bacterium]
MPLFQPGPRRVFLVILAGLVASNCARFRIEELEPSLLTSIPIAAAGGANPEQLPQGMLQGRVVYNFPARAVADNKYVYVSDPARGVVRAYARGSGKPQKVFGSAKPPGDDVKFVKIRQGIPGWVAADGEGNVYIQVRPSSEAGEEKVRVIPPEDRVPQETSAEINLSPSYIVHVNDSDEAVTLGKTGPGGDPFAGIYRMDAAEDDLLFVLTADGTDKSLSVFRKDKRVRTFEIKEPGNEQDRKTFHVEVEDIVPHIKGEYALASVAFRNKNTFDAASRRVYKILSTGSVTEIMRTRDVEDFFCWLKPDGGFYMLNTEGDGTKMLLKTYTGEGEYLNNRLITFPGLRSSWRDLYLTVDGKIYTTRLLKGKLELYEWK